jgi:hypothetical protein
LVPKKAFNLLIRNIKHLPIGRTSISRSVPRRYISRENNRFAEVSRYKPETAHAFTPERKAAQKSFDALATAAEPTVPTVFQGTTLRGMILNAYGWWQMGQIALISSIARFALGAIAVVLSVQPPRYPVLAVRSPVGRVRVGWPRSPSWWRP